MLLLRIVLSTLGLLQLVKHLRNPRVYPSHEPSMLLHIVWNRTGIVEFLPPIALTLVQTPLHCPDLSHYLQQALWGQTPKTKFILQKSSRQLCFICLICEPYKVKQHCSSQSHHCFCQIHPTMLSVGKIPSQVETLAKFIHSPQS